MRAGLSRLTSRAPLGFETLAQIGCSRIPPNDRSSPSVRGGQVMTV